MPWGVIRLSLFPARFVNLALSALTLPLLHGQPAGAFPLRHRLGSAESNPAGKFIDIIHIWRILSMESDKLVMSSAGSERNPRAPRTIESLPLAINRPSCLTPPCARSAAAACQAAPGCGDSAYHPSVKDQGPCQKHIRWVVVQSLEAA